MANQWLRLWHDMPNDPKWRTIARISKQSIGNVLAVYLHLLTSASQNVTRGHADVTEEDLASAIDITEDEIQAILTAMQGRVLDEQQLTGWDKRQPKREDSGNEETGTKSSTERKREQREREKLSTQSCDVTNVTQCHVDVTGNVTCHEDRDKCHVLVTNECDIKDVISTDLYVQVIDVNDVSQMSRNVTTDKDKDKDKDKDNKEELKKKRAPKNVNSEITFSEFMEQCKSNGESAIREDDPIFDWAKTVSLPSDYLDLGWIAFKGRSWNGKKYTDWRATFRNYVRDGYLQVWEINRDGEYYLTLKGKQLERENNGAPA